MAEVLLTQAVNEAEEAIESGNYGGAIEACQRILGQFPEFAGAHRIMAEAYAEKGDYEAAREAYQRTLERDPQSIPAHLGLGMLAEEAEDRESALAYVQVAWEIDPRRRDLREHVSRISQQLYGADGRLYLTRAALASLHFHAGRWDRAVSEAAQVLQEYSSRIDVQVRLSEALWRRGDDAQAKQVASTILRSLPSAVVPLLILADIHRREGDLETAQDYLEQARDIDPDGVRAADLIMVGFDDQADFLAVADIPTIDDQLVHEEPARYAPAPDFTAADSDDLEPVVDDPAAQDDIVVPTQPEAGAEQTAPEWSNLEAGGVQPFRWEDVGDEDLEISDLDEPSASGFALPTDEEIEQARPGGERGYTETLDSLESQGMEPFDPAGRQQESDQEAAASEIDWDDFSLPTDEEIEKARPTGEHAGGFTGMLSSLDAEGMQPFDPTGGASEHESARPVDSVASEDQLQQDRGYDEMLDSLESEGMDPFDPAGGTPAQDSGHEPPVGGDDWLSDLQMPIHQEQSAAQADATEESADNWLSEFSLPSEEEIQEARPSEERPAGFTGMLDSLDAEGMEPFDPTGSSEQPGREDVAADAGDESDADGALALDDVGHDSPFELDWTQIDQEIEEARPSDMPRGHTEELRSLDDDGLEPFAFGESENRDADSQETIGMTPELPEADDQTGLDPELPVDDAGGLDSIGVVFDEEVASGYADTEPLQADRVPDETQGIPEDFLVHELVDEPMDFGGGLDIDLPESVEMADETASELVSRDPVSKPVARETFAHAGPMEMNIPADRLGLDEALIDRARQMKQALIDQGRISGTTPLQETVESVDSLRDAVEHDPHNIDRRIELAHSLLQSNPDEALEHYRWLYRNAPERGEDVVRDLAQLIDIMREREVGVHRLLGALYRRHGDWAAAASHYEESLSNRRWRR